MADASTSSGARCTWQHEEPRGLSAAVGAAFERARKGDWAGGAAGAWGTPEVADARALVIATLYLIDHFSSEDATFQMLTSSLLVGERGQAQFATSERLQLAQALTRTWAVVLKNAKDLGAKPDEIGTSYPRSFESHAGDAPANVVAASGWPLAIGVVAVVAGVAWMWNSYQTNETTRALSKERTARMMSAHAGVLHVFDAHRQSELAASPLGSPLPFSDAEKQMIAALLAAQDAAASGDAQHDRDVPKGGILDGILGSGGPGTALGATLGTVEMLAIAGVIYAVAAKH